MRLLKLSFWGIPLQDKTYFCFFKGFWLMLVWFFCLSAFNLKWCINEMGGNYFIILYLLFFLFSEEKKMQVVQWGLKTNLLWEVVVFGCHLKTVTQNQVKYLHKRAKPVGFSPRMHRNELFGIWNCSFPFKLFLRSSFVIFFFLGNDCWW